MHDVTIHQPLMMKRSGDPRSTFHEELENAFTAECVKQGGEFTAVLQTRMNMSTRVNFAQDNSSRRCTCDIAYIQIRVIGAYGSSPDYNQKGIMGERSSAQAITGQTALGREVLKS